MNANEASEVLVGVIISDLLYGTYTQESQNRYHNVKLFCLDWEIHFNNQSVSLYCLNVSIISIASDVGFALW